MRQFASIERRGESSFALHSNLHQEILGADSKRLGSAEKFTGKFAHFHDPLNLEPLRLFDQEIAIRFKAGKDGSPRTGGHQLFSMLSTENLKELETRGTEVRTPVNGIGYDTLVFRDKESWFDEIGVVGGVR